MSTAGLPSSGDVVRAFEHGEVLLPGLDHANHVHLAWAYLENLSLIEALARFPAAIQRFAIAQDSAEKYNATLTIAHLLLIHERRQRLPSADWATFRDANPDLFEWPGGPVTDLYSSEVLNSAAARRKLIPPDLTAVLG